MFTTTVYGWCVVDTEESSSLFDCQLGALFIVLPCSLTVDWVSVLYAVAVSGLTDEYDTIV